MSPSFCPTKTTKHFFPLSCFLFSTKNMHRCCGITQACWRQHCLSSAFFSQRILSIFANYFFSISSICFPLLYLYKKAQTTTFLIKFLRCFFFSFTYFSYFSWVWRLFYFLTFFLQGLGKANSRVWRGPDWLIFAVWHEAGELLMHKAIFPMVMWHHTADPIGGFLWVSFVAFTS